MSEIKICGVPDVSTVVEQFKIKKILSCLANYKIIDEIYGLTPSVLALDPTYWSNPSNWLRVNMEDIVDPDERNAPNKKEVVNGITFGANAIKAGNDLLVHCQLGVSRSPAMAIGCIIASGDTIENAFQRAKSAKINGGRIDPNPLIISIVDEYLKLNGELVNYNNQYRSNTRVEIKKEYNNLMESYIGDTKTLSVILDNISALDRL